MLNHEDFIKEFENHEFLFYDINWWPLVKVQVAYQVHLKNCGIFKLSDSNKCFSQVPLKITLKERFKYYKQSFKRSKSIKNIIVTDSNQKINSAYNETALINPYTDPFIDCFEKLKIDYCIFDFKKEDFFLGHDIKILRKIYLELVKNEFNKNSDIKFKLKQFCDFLTQQYGIDFKLYNHLVENIITNQAEYFAYFNILKKSNVKNILLYCYYNNTMMSIIRAANQLNIATVEYQHSQVTSNHFAYSSWKAMQGSGKDFFPSKIWAWRQSDAAYLEGQFQDIKKINYIIGGNLSLELSKKIKKIKTDSHIRVLVTLQGTGLPDYIINSLDRHPNVVLYLRLHPRYSQDKEICEMLKLKYKEQIEIDKANSLTLYKLFNFVDYHLTNFSGSAIEAEYFDVTNIIYGDKGYLCYENEITTKKYLFIKDQEDLDFIFEQKINYKSNSRAEKKDIYKLITENFN
ncbi:hypothetical protein EYY60_09830 [Flavobacterium zhairuonense]|uniref:hypothetical protein n=1 Tax=Flavobacterium zhairuonense TaxID=2493631 RepID=UPI0010442633|nr:hypothetical protein [Flavobacterium zhairuonense]KAF2510799.1 hypothetical protein EYY60_09830 [Flavobacterium zhairuonense]